ncbi:MAG TPA: hypothetical protein VFX16_22020 [Pseudonocardiaceae bacterium]|nr:hypothetical protein [Pseudonocardiaceae bacterium]
MDVDTVLDELFAAPREEFTALRDSRVKQARSAGDRQLVDQLKRLRKPTVAAWLVNQVSRAHPDDIDRLAQVGDALRAAHHALAGEQLRDLSSRRNELIHVLTAHARVIAANAGHLVGDAAVEQIENSWTAAVTNADAAAAVRAGQLSSALQPTSAQDWLTAAMGTPALVSPRQESNRLPDGIDATVAENADVSATKNAELAKQEAIRQARRSVTDRTQVSDKARKTLAKTEQAATDAEAAANDLRQQLAALSARVANATEREKTSRKQADTAREAVALAEQATAEAEEVLRKLEADS